MMRRKTGTVLLVAGTALVLLAVGFRLFAVPVLVRFPSDLDRTLHYSGTYTEYFDQRSATPLAAPVQRPFRLDRHVHVVDSGASTVVLAEDLTLHQGAQTLHQHNQYMMDRRSMKLEDSARSWSLSPKNLVNRTGAYRLTF
ncbi:MAG: porin PorA family protein, partial [Acidimicrobiia bacterium]